MIRAAKKNKRKGKRKGGGKIATFGGSAKKKPKTGSNGSARPRSEEPQNKIKRRNKKAEDIFVAKLLASKDPKRGFEFFSWLINPISPKTFLKDYYEKKHLLVQRNPMHTGGSTGEANTKADDGEDEEKHYFSGIYSSEDIKESIEEPKHDIHYARDIDITKCNKGVRKTLNLQGRASTDVVWKKIAKGCSVRVLRPQEYSKTVYGMVALMDEYWGRVAGANAYLTPPNTQGFAPHYDDVDVYILQLEGRKRWRLYPPRSDSDVLPRYSSEDIDPEDLPEPMLDTVLAPGDLLYAPRGTIHQAVALPNGPASLHLTLSSGQLHTWADYLSLVVPRAVQLAAEEDKEFRQSLPISFHDYMGVIHCEKKPHLKRREAFKATARKLLEKLLAEEFLPFDAAADQVAREFVHGRVPPPEAEEDAEKALQAEKMLSEGGDGGDGEEKKENYNNSSAVGEGEKKKLTETMQIALVSKGCCRLIMEEEAAVIYYCTRNSKVFKERDEQFLPFADHCAPALERLIDAYPHYIRVSELEGLEKEEQLIVANVLHEAGVVVAKSG